MRALLALCLVATTAHAEQRAAPPQAFERKCAVCHTDGPMFPGTSRLKESGDPVPVLADKKDLDTDTVKQIVRHGLGSMPIFFRGRDLQRQSRSCRSLSGPEIARMMTRRAVIATGLASGLVASLPTLVFAASAGVQNLIYQSWLDPVGAFARAMACRNILKVEVGDDLGTAAMAFGARWADQPFPLAGLTTQSGLFVMQQLAIRRQLVLAYEGRHRHLGGGRWQHDLSFGGGIDPRSIDALDQAADWRRAVGALLASFHLLAGLGRQHRIESREAQVGIEPDYAVSWLLLPRRRTGLVA